MRRIWKVFKIQSLHIFQVKFSNPEIDDVLQTYSWSYISK